jgi:ATP-dependent exoDNAse (exonuclease V) beta subunit
MTEPAADQAQRDEALDTARSFIVQAPAGSGKTELLTQRFLALLAGVRDPEQILAITFTRKAAAEMRNRILGALDAAAGPRPEAAHRRRTWDLARAALARDQARGWQLRATPNRLRIQTFDSLGHSLARQMPLLSALGAPPATTDQAEPLYREAARKVLAELDSVDIGDDLAVLLRHLDNRVQRLEALLTAMLGRRDQWLPHAGRQPDSATLNASLDRIVADHLARLRATCPADWLHRLRLLGGEARRHAVAGAAGAAPLVLDTDASALDDWRFLADLLLTRNRTPRRSWTAAIGFPAPSERGLDAAEKQRRRQAKDDIADLAAALDSDPALLDAWALVPLLPPAGLDARQQRVLDSLFRVLLHAAAELQLVFQTAGEVDFAEVQIRAQRALGTPEEPTDLALRLDYSLQHLLVDEFQDTSVSQFRLLATLVAGWQPGDGCTLFAVGDPMQSIYRFREAEVGNFLSARAHGIGSVRPEPLNLAVNFRASGAVVDWLNRAFPTVLAPTVDIARGAVPYSPALARDSRPDADAVQVHPFVGAQPEAEAERVVALVRAARAEMPDGSIAILSRARSHLAPIAAALTRAGIRYQAVDIDPLLQRPVVRDLRALLRALLHPGDRLAWLTLLRAPWLGLALDDLLQLAGAAADSVPARLRDSTVVAGLSADAQRRVARLRSVIEPRLPYRGRQPLRHWLEGIWLALGGAAVGGGAVGGGAHDDARAFFALLERHEQARALDGFGRFDEALAQLYAAPDPAADDRLQLMTMHKAKGLEFDTVILPGLGRKPRSQEAELLYWAEQPDSAGVAHLLMAPIRGADETDEPISRFLRAVEQDKQAFETARLLYVAATRARRRLHLLGHIAVKDGQPASQPAAGCLLRHLWPVVSEAFATAAAAAATVASAAVPRQDRLRRLPADWAPALGDDPAAPPLPDADNTAERIEFDWAGDTARHVGTLVHRYLERVASEGLERWPLSRLDELDQRLAMALTHLGVAPDELDRAVEKTGRALRLTLAHDTGRWILGDHAEAHCEWPLTLCDEHPQHYVIDRSFVDATGTRWIVDYKTGEHLDGDRDAFLDQEQARYRQQLETYARLLRRLEDRPIRLALYFPLCSDWRTWAFVD